MFRKTMIALILMSLTGCSNLAMQCTGTYTGKEVRDGASNR